MGKKKEVNVLYKGNKVRGSKISLVKDKSSRKKHPQGRKISSDLYKALNILASNFYEIFSEELKALEDKVKKEEAGILYREKFKRHFKEKDFLNLPIEIVNDFNEEFKKDLVFITICNKK